MKFEIDLTSHTPVYLEIMGQVKRAIATGELKPGDQLPTVRQMAADLRVNFNTIARAYRLLGEAGGISTQQGGGTYFFEPFPPAQATGLRSAALRGLASSFLADAARLGFTPQEVLKAAQAMIERWKEEGSPPGDESN